MLLCTGPPLLSYSPLVSHCCIRGKALQDDRIILRSWLHAPAEIVQPLSMTMSFQDIVRCFPKFRGLFAYGSAAFQQPGLYPRFSASSRAPMMDLLFAADNPLAWHRENIARNPDHYSFVSGLRPSMMCSLCEAVGRGVHFNPYANFGGQDVKYGVVSTSVLMHDLWTWDDLFLAGRMQKPVLVVAEDAILDGAVRANLDSALAAALLLLPAYFSSQALMESLCGLSYMGDVRMTWGEDRRKVQRIVQGSWPALLKSFLPQLEGTIGKAADLGIKSKGSSFQELKWGDTMEQSLGLPQSELLLSFLPQACVDEITNRHGQSGVRSRMAIAASLLESLRWRVKASSVRQAVWGVASAGPHRALRYAMAKFEKGRD